MGLPPFTYFAKYSHGYRHLTHPLESCSERGHAAPLPKHGYALFGQHGMDLGFEARALMNEVHLGDAYRVRVESLRDLIEACDREITMLEEHIAPILAGDLGYQSVQTIPGVGPILASIFVAEIGDISRFSSARHLCSWAGLTPTHRESDEKVRRGHITKQGSRLVRWAAVEAVARQRADSPIRAHHRRVGERRGKQVGRVAAARKLLMLVYYGLRDGEIRCLAKTE